MAVTVRDVAKNAGVSIATVSRVLNDPTAVTQETRGKVHAAIATLQYLPNLNAAALRRNHIPKEKMVQQTISPSAAARNASAPHLSEVRNAQKATNRLGALKQENQILKRLLRRFSRDVIKYLDAPR
jgi:DNA-binding LacI/PurR family transcriptional regulator